MNRQDYFCEDYSEFGEVLMDMSQEVSALAMQVPSDGLFQCYRDRLFAVAVEFAAIDGGLRTAIAMTHQTK